MTYPATGIFSTGCKFAKMLSNLPSIQNVLEAADAATARAKITTYSEDYLAFPRCIIVEQDVHTETDESGTQLINVPTRMLGAELAFYVPNNDPTVVTIDDERCYVVSRFGEVFDELLAASGTPGNLAIYDPVLYQPERTPSSERIDDAEAELGDDARSLWFGTLAVSVR